MKFTKTHENLLLITIIIIVFFFWNSILVFPIKLITVIFHELSHVIVIFITGGTTLSVEITDNLGGVTKSKDANEIAVLCCGYLGSIVFGALTYLFSHNQKLSRRYLAFMSILILLFGLILIKNDFGKIFSVITAFVFMGFIFIKNPIILSLVLKTIALINISYIVNDVIYDTFLTTSLYSDAVRLEQLTGINDWLWGIAWLFMAALALYFIIRHMLRKRKI